MLRTITRQQVQISDMGLYSYRSDVIRGSSFEDIGITKASHSRGRQ